MAAPTRTPRTAWIDEGLRTLAAGGPDAVRVEAIAQVLGVSKGGFYWHFDDRRGLLEEMLDTWERVMVDRAIELVETGGGDGRTRMRRLFALSASREIRDMLRIDLAVRDWARRDAAVAKRLKRVDNRRMNYLRSLFEDFRPDAADVEARCLLVMSLFVGHHFVAAAHGSQSRKDVVTQALDLLVGDADQIVTTPVRRSRRSAGSSRRSPRP